MSISAINKRTQAKPIRKTVMVYLALTAAAIAFDNIYALFGHGVRSQAMSLMFLYPLLGGVLFYSMVGLFIPGIGGYKHYRLFYNIYNSSMAILTVGSLLKGILDIAGTSSPYVFLFNVAGWAGAAAGIVFVFLWLVKFLFFKTF